MYSDEDTKIYEDGDDYEEDVVSRPKKVKKNTRQNPRKESKVNNFEDNDTLHAVLEPEKEQIVPPEMLKRIKGHDFGMKDYVD
jgi:hypothetical protein